MKISAEQIKAARALINWTQGDLAQAADLAASTVRALESGQQSSRRLGEVRAALERAGIVFLADDGVKRRDDQVRVLKGRDAGRIFLDELMDAARGADPDILFAGRSLDLFAKAIGLTSLCDPRAVSRIAGLGPVRCIVSDAPPALQGAGLDCRQTSQGQLGLSSYIVFGERCAELKREACGSPLIVIFSMPMTALEYRNHFAELWNSAVLVSPKATRGALAQRGLQALAPIRSGEVWDSSEKERRAI